ncbi:hypothetical protein [Streptomyces sp. BA2]|uniref:hypothetical protein n=1 Tax=Streptomyces sp. BA2 TaxID=436595 RepID=UPI00132B979F|nr:hypothetical protein [Streptomyces sp. BA2]MWA13153.1 hypothetical protein [Streptomyces sp. BA2]
MADEDYRWLDRDAAERLLSGESIDGADDHAREQAAQLAKALAALAADERAGSVVPADVSSELPGEAAALAAFREARGTKARAASTRVGAGETVRIGRSAGPPRPARWARPLRYGLAAVLAGCMVGGVAVAAGTGVLPSPFGDRDQPGPAASASSVASPEPLASPSEGESGTPDVKPDDVTTTPEDPSREPGSSAPPQESAAPDGVSKGTPGNTQPGSGDPQRDDEAKDWHRRVVSACRDYRSGELQGEKRRRLEEAAKGSRRVTEFCGRVLDGSGSDREHNNGGSGSGGSDGDGDKGGDSDKGNGDSDGDGSSGGGNDHWGNGGSGPVPPVVTPTASRPAPAPTASYSAQPVPSGS